MPKNETSHHGLRYAEFLVQMVKAMQEHQEMTETQQEQIAQLLRRIETLEGGVQDK